MVKSYLNLSFGYRYAEGDLLYPVFIIQAIMFSFIFYPESSIKGKKQIKRVVGNDDEKALISILNSKPNNFVDIFFIWIYSKDYKFFSFVSLAAR